MFIYEGITKKMFCVNHTGKMRDMWSLSTIPFNRFCDGHCKIKGSICEHCYSRKMMNMYEALKNKLQKNADIINDRIYPVEEMPKIKKEVFRFEAFGDLCSVIQVKNYFNLCYANPQTMFAMWTKNPDIIRRALMKDEITGDKWEKPKNLVILYSSLFINVLDPEGELAKIKERYPFIDKIFSVYDKEHASAHNINCGARSCNKCRRCYKKNTAKVINELLK